MPDRETDRREKKPQLRPCPFCGGDARYAEYHVLDGYIGYAAGDVACMDCGARTRSAPVDGTCGVQWTEEDFAALWNRRAARDNPAEA